MMSKETRIAKRHVPRLAIGQWRQGRFQERHGRATGAFAVKIAERKPAQGRTRLCITWTRRQRWSDWAALPEGGYRLRNNLTESDPVTLLKQYIQLTEAKWAFRIEKDELAHRPIRDHSKISVLRPAKHETEFDSLRFAFHSHLKSPAVLKFGPGPNRMCGFHIHNEGNHVSTAGYAPHPPDDSAFSLSFAAGDGRRSRQRTAFSASPVDSNSLTSSRTVPMV